MGRNYRAQKVVRLTGKLAAPTANSLSDPGLMPSLVRWVKPRVGHILASKVTFLQIDFYTMNLKIGEYLI